MNTSDRNELRKRYKKDCPITRVQLRYVNAQKETVVQQGSSFGSMSEEDKFKYFDIAKKSLSGKIGDNLMDLSYTTKAENSDQYKLLNRLLKSKLKDEDAVNELFDQITASYQCDGNFLITAIHDSYDVQVKTSDKMKLDESEEVYDYIMVSICPMTQTKAALGFNKDGKSIGSMEKVWVAGAPVLAFTYPSFTDRSSDIHSVTVYYKDPKATQEVFTDQVLGCAGRKTASQCRDLLEDAVSENSGLSMLTLHEILMDMEEAREADGTSLTITPDIIVEAVKTACPDDEAVAEKIAEACKDTFDGEEPPADSFIDKKALKKTEAERRESELLNENAVLREQLRSAGLTPEKSNKPASGRGVRVRVPAGVRKKVEVSEDGTYIKIPIDENGYEVTEI